MTTAPIPRVRLLFGLVSLAGMLLPLPAPAAHDGARLYAQHCAACHGAQGKGGVGVPLALPDFLAQANDNYLRQTIRLGRPGRVMPAFAQLSDAEVNAIVGYLRALAPAGMKPVTVKAKPGEARARRETLRQPLRRLPRRARRGRPRHRRHFFAPARSADPRAGAQQSRLPPGRER